MNALAAVFTAALAAYLVYGRSNSASNVGFSLVMAGQFKRIYGVLAIDALPNLKLDLAARLCGL